MGRLKTMHFTGEQRNLKASEFSKGASELRLHAAIFHHTNSVLLIEFIVETFFGYLLRG